MKTHKEMSQIMLINILSFPMSYCQYSIFKQSDTQLPEEQHQSIRESSEIIVSIDGCAGLEINRPKYLQTNAVINSRTWQNNGLINYYINQ